MGYLVTGDLWDSIPGGTAAWGLSWVSWDTKYHGDNLGPPAWYVILGCPMYPGMSRIVLGQVVAVLNIPQKEALGTVWACKKFVGYIITDHRPLVPLLSKQAWIICHHEYCNLVTPLQV